MIAVRELPAMPADLERVIDDARELAWWPHGNPSDTEIYRARKGAFARLQASLLALEDPPAASAELGYLIAAARRLAEHNGSNRWGVAYYERKAAFAQLRGCLAVYDRVAAP